jgi:hypothetical protein
VTLFADVAHSARYIMERTDPDESGESLYLTMESVYEALPHCRVITLDPEQVNVLPNIGPTDDALSESAASMVALLARCEQPDGALPFRNVLLDFGQGIELNYEGAWFSGESIPGRGTVEGTWRYYLKGAMLRWTPQDTETTLSVTPLIGSNEPSAGIRVRSPGVMIAFDSEVVPEWPPVEDDDDDYFIDKAEHGRFHGIMLPSVSAQEQGVLPVLHSATRTGVMAVARVLEFLDAFNVDVVPAPESRQVRRRREREGTPQVNFVVAIRQSARRERPATNGHREFSHRFERRGHYRHVTRGSHAKPEHMKPCSRCGTCRREWVPPHVVGPQDKVLIPKRRDVKPTRVGETADATSRPAS